MEELFFEYGVFFKVTDTGLAPMEEIKSFNESFYNLWKSIYDCKNYKNYGEKDWEVVLVENHYQKYSQKKCSVFCMEKCTGGWATRNYYITNGSDDIDCEEFKKTFKSGIAYYFEKPEDAILFKLSMEA
jgi:hypothetical protein